MLQWHKLSVIINCIYSIHGIDLRFQLGDFMSFLLYLCFGLDPPQEGRDKAYLLRMLQDVSQKKKEKLGPSYVNRLLSPTSNSTLEAGQRTQGRLLLLHSNCSSTVNCFDYYIQFLILREYFILLSCCLYQIVRI